MNKKWLIAVGIVLALLVGLGGGTVLAQNGDGGTGSQAPGSVTVSIPNQQVGIWVTGQGKVTVVPDLAVYQVGVEAQAPTVSEAQAQASRAMDAVMKALADNRVARSDIQTRYFNITRVTRWDNERQQEILIGYRVSNTVNVKIRDLGATGAVIDAVAAAGGDLTRIDGIAFTVDDNADAVKQARDKAMADAKAKAEQLARLGGVTLGKPTYISENSYVPYPPPVPAFDSREAIGAATPISPGEMDVTVSVQVTYAIAN